MSQSGDKSLRRSATNDTPTPETIETDEMVEIASFGAPHGVHGEVRLFEAQLDSPVFEAGRTLWVRLRDGWESLTISQIRETPKHGIGEFEELEGRDEAARMRNEPVYIPVEQLPEPDEGEFYQAQLQGHGVYMATDPLDGAEGGLELDPSKFRRVGRVGGFFDTNGANDVMVVLVAGDEELFVPMIEGAVAAIDDREQKVWLHHPDGWGPDGLAVPEEVPEPASKESQTDGESHG
jgi:ribosomal 30S subunit maturation factor RimM